MTVQAGLCQTWSKTQIVGFLINAFASEKHLEHQHVLDWVFNGVG